MADDRMIRDLLARGVDDADGPRDAASAIDLDAVLSRSRRRRRPRVAAVTGGALLAAAAVIAPATLVANGALSGAAGDFASETAGLAPDAEADDAAGGAGSAAAAAGCGVSVDELGTTSADAAAGVATDLAITVTARESRPGSLAEITLRNEGSGSLTLDPLPIQIVLLDDDQVVAAGSAGGEGTGALDLGRGETAVLTAPIPSACPLDGRDDALPPGDYSVIAIVTVVGADGAARSVVSPAASLDAGS